MHCKTITFLSISLNYLLVQLSFTFLLPMPLMPLPPFLFLLIPLLSFYFPLVYLHPSHLLSPPPCPPHLPSHLCLSFFSLFFSSVVKVPEIPHWIFSAAHNIINDSDQAACWFSSNPSGITKLQIESLWTHISVDSTPTSTITKASLFLHICQI